MQVNINTLKFKTQTVKMHWKDIVFTTYILGDNNLYY